MFSLVLDLTDFSCAVFVADPFGTMMESETSKTPVAIHSLRDNLSRIGGSSSSPPISMVSASPTEKFGCPDFEIEPSVVNVNVFVKAASVEFEAINLVKLIAFEGGFGTGNIPHFSLWL